MSVLMGSSEAYACSQARKRRGRHAAVSRFLAGFAAATVVWGSAAAALHFALGWGPPSEPEEVAEIEEATEIAAAPEETTKRRGGRRSGRRGSRSTEGSIEESVPRGDAVTGDDLREGEMRVIDGEGTGGEQQLSGAEIDAAFDGAMGRIRRCFVLAAGDDPVRGRLTFGLRIAGSGRATAVNLSGPAVVTTGDCGECLRDAARAIQFPRFDGPEMVVRYPITLE
ncbi:Hypothetical protein I5071_25620 [Sandaracinus amylolyticus]|nr:Hypothetical protein I5071_25620 [Sandaracinus amylolyticus]